MRPYFHVLKGHYPRAEKAALYNELGWADLNDKEAYKDTCAIRMSYCLLRAGVQLPGAHMKVRAGVLSGGFIEPRQAALSNILAQIWGAPEVYKSEAAARAGVGSRTGMVSFFRISRGSGGHIDLIWREPGHLYQDCVRSCYFSAVTVWFWPLV